ncbi:MAG: hypothetical protein ACYDIA_09815 [Candidatus Humimicrobiaceae bacterium]
MNNVPKRLIGNLPKLGLRPVIEYLIKVRDLKKIINKKIII